MKKLRATGFHRIRSRSLEVRILLAGALLLGIVALELSLVTLADREAGLAMWRGTAIEMVVGREGGIPVSLGGGAPAWLVAQVSATQDIGVVCLAYPAFMMLVQWMRARRPGEGFLMRRVLRLQRAALSRKGFAKRWGPVGVFAFMLVPFLVNGPLLGAIAGRVAGLTTKQLMLPVVAATIVSALAWSFAYDAVFDAIGGIDPRIPPIVTGAVVAVLIGYALVAELMERRRKPSS